GLRDLFNSETAFATMGVMLAGTALLALVALPARPGGNGDEDSAIQPSLPWAQMVRQRSIQGAVLFMALMASGWGAAFSFIAIFVVSEDGLNLNSTLFVGLLLSVRQFTNAALQPITGRLADRVDRIQLVATGLTLMALST